MTIWKDLGNGNSSRPDNYGWCTLLWHALQWERTYAPADEVCESMPYAHHQIGLFP